MTRKPVALSRTKRPVKAIGQSRSNIEQRSLSRGLVVRHSSLKKVARAEILVKKGEVFEAQVRLFDLNVGVEVAVRLLSGRDPRDEVVNLPLERRIGVAAEHVRSALDPFVDVRVRPPGSPELTCGLLRRDVEIADAPRGLELLIHVVEGLGSIHFEARRPELVFNGDLLQRDVADPGCGRLV